METKYFGETDVRIQRSVVTIGNFDGLHLGHQELLRQAREEANQLHVPLVVVSFDPHPGKVLYPQKAPEIIKTQKQKRDLLRQMGVDIFFVIRFTPELSRMEPEDFVTDILVGTLGAQRILVGHGFAFGRKRRGNVAMLEEMGARMGFGVKAVSSVMLDGEVVSSSRIRTLLKNGRVRQANRLLGRSYYMEGIVIRGEQLGRKLGYPTANILSENELTPMLGVYATRTRLGDRLMPSVTNIGFKPTFGGRTIVVETHIFDFDEDIYGEQIGVEYVAFIRPEERFDRIEDLVAEIRNDCALSREILLEPSSKSGVEAHHHQVKKSNS